MYYIYESVRAIPTYRVYWLYDMWPTIYFSRFGYGLTQNLQQSSVVEKPGSKKARKPSYGQKVVHGSPMPQFTSFWEMERLCSMFSYMLCITPCGLFAIMILPEKMARDRAQVQQLKISREVMDSTFRKLSMLVHTDKAACINTLTTWRREWLMEGWGFTAFSSAHTRVYIAGLSSMPLVVGGTVDHSICTLGGGFLVYYWWARRKLDIVSWYLPRLLAVLSFLHSVNYPQSDTKGQADWPFTQHPQTYTICTFHVHVLVT